MSRVKIIEDDKKVELKDVSIRDKKLIPQYEITKTDGIETHLDKEGNVMGYVKRKFTVSVIKLSPEEYFGDEIENAKSDGKKIKKTG